MHTCMHASTYIHIHTHTKTCVCMCIYTHVYTCIYIYTHQHTHNNACTYTCICAYAYIYICLYTYARMCIYIYTHVHTHTHIYIYIYTHVSQHWDICTKAAGPPNFPVCSRETSVVRRYMKSRRQTRVCIRRPQLEPQGLAGLSDLSNTRLREGPAAEASCAASRCIHFCGLGVWVHVTVPAPCGAKVVQHQWGEG